MTTISGTLSANGASPTLALGNVNEDVTLTIDGPFDGTLALERATTPDELAWEIIANGPYLGNSSVDLNVRVNKHDRLRVRAKDIPANAITNGTFAADTDWTKGTGWTIGSGVATAGTSTSTDLEQTIATGLVEGASYELTFTMTRTSGSITPSLGGTAGTSRNSANTYSETIVAGATELVEFTGAAFSGTIDGVTLVPVVTYSFGDTDAVLEEVKDPDGNVQLTRKQSGYTFPQVALFDLGIVGDVVGSVTGPAAAEVVEATNVITAEESGTTFFLNHATEFASTLPAPALGLRYKFIVAAAPAGANYTIATNGGANIIIGGINELEVDAGDDGPYSAVGDLISFVQSVAVVGDWCEVISDGTSWFLTGQTRADGGITIGST